MTWKQFRIAFRLLSPMHIGYRKVGNLMQTRSYVPAWILWAALTARITRDLGKGANGQSYQDIGLKVRKCFRFSYLWPAIIRNGKTRVETWDDLETIFLFPIKDDKHINELFPKSCNEKSSVFDYLFLDSQQGTAISQSVQTAEEGSLHDIEFISPYTRGNPSSVYLAGSIWLDENLPEELKDWKKSLKNIRIGGELSYGWGRVELIVCDPAESTINPDGFSWDGQIPAHLYLKGFENNVQGGIEPLVGWHTQIDGSQKIREAVIAYITGSVIRDENAEFVIGEMGIWKLGKASF